MRVLVDTPVWSEYLRRGFPQPNILQAFEKLIVSNDVVLIGPVRQEILSGVKVREQFDKLKTAISAFPDEPILTSDYEEAATMFNACRSQGIQGSNTDFLVCAVSKRLSAPVFTLDKDFELFSKVLSTALFR